MSVRTRQRTDGAIFYCTFTCWQWLPLIERTSTYDHIYSWMHIAKTKGFRIFGYVIMPNHVHLVIHAAEGLSINALLANAKRFLAYEIRDRLIKQGDMVLLEMLKAAVRPSDAARGQEYRVFMPSSDIRECFDEAMIQQKLDYIHTNPVKGKWMLADNYLDYPHSSAGFYERGDAATVPVEHYQLALRS
ncbi:MAG: transposase [Flavobacteriales bacterium]|jgi:REP element-mobilizing transposase RayT|nr:transposase [Flavobacteriales bacterium]MBK6894330.1 transposase [Flavobacteriales bacterium]MBK7248260.1 transposase [Flavobacteriales bacterium]MBK7287387.1 transposase [Flavobacteriales bacterium]MBK9598089.1 transposase [Flavobacteriales bacterium]